MVAIALAAYDYMIDMHTVRGTAADESELFYARCAVLHAARVAIPCYDVVYSDVNDEEGFLREIGIIKRLGFDPEVARGPRPDPTAARIAAPTEAEVDQAKRVIEAADKAEAEVSACVSLDGKMVDAGGERLPHGAASRVVRDQALRGRR